MMFCNQICPVFRKLVDISKKMLNLILNGDLNVKDATGYPVARMSDVFPLTLLNGRKL